MINYDELPGIQREILRQLYFLPDHEGTAQAIADKCFYPNPEVYQALGEMKEQGLVFVAFFQLTENVETTTYSPSAQLLEQMKEKNKTDTENLNKGLEDLKRKFGYE